MNRGEKEIKFYHNGRFLQFYKRNSPLMYKYDLSTGDFFCFRRSDETRERRSSSDVRRWFKDCKVVTDDQKLVTMFQYCQARCRDKNNVKHIMELFNNEQTATVEKWAALGIQLTYSKGFGTRNYQRETEFNISQTPSDVPADVRTYVSSKTWTIADLNKVLNCYHNADDLTCQIFQEINEHPEYESAFIRVARGVTHHHLYDEGIIRTLTNLANRFNLKIPRLMIYLHYLNEIEKIDVLDLICSYESYLEAELEKCEGKKNKMFKYPNNYKSVFFAQQEVLRRKRELANYDFSEDAVANQHLEYADDDFMIIVPKSPEDVEDEGRQQKHCIAQSYLDHIACGDTVCVFMRRTSEPDKSLITIEIRNNKIRQACIGKNHTVPEDLQGWIINWACLKGIEVDDDSWSTTLVY